MSDDRDFQEELNITKMEISLPDHLIEFIEWTYKQDEWSYLEDLNIWAAMDSDINYKGEEAITLQQLFEYFLKTIYNK